MNNFSIVLLIGILAWQGYLLFNATRLAANATKLAEDATKLAANATKRVEEALRESLEVHRHARSVIEEIAPKKEYSSVKNNREK